MSDRLNFPIWADADTNTTGFTLQHLVNGSWVDTDMRTYPMPAGYESEICINRYVEKDIKSTAPDFSYSGTTGITPQPDAYQVYRMDIDGVVTREIGFFNDWSYEMFTGNTRCISAPINRHADSRQKLVYGNFAESGNSIIVKPVIVADIKMQPSAITIGAEQYQTITIVVTSNTSFELILPAWLTASQTAFTSGTTVAYLYPQANTSFDTRQFTIQAKHDAYRGEGYEYTDLAQVAQAGKVAYLTIYPDPLGFAWDTTGLTSVTVNTNTDFTATTNSSDTWFTYSGKTEVGVNYYDVYFKVSANTGDYRQTHAYFEYVVDSSGGTQTRASRVVQAKAPDITIEPQVREIDYTAQGIRIQVTSEANWTATSSESWISVPTSGTSGVSLIFVDVTNNPYYISRSGSVIFSNGARQVTFNVLQNSVELHTIMYTSANDTAIIPNNITGFGATYVDSVYYPEQHAGCWIFEGEPTTLGWYCLADCSGLTSIIIPDTITRISFYAFKNCVLLSSITIPDSVTRIDTGVFSGCTSLTSVTIPDSVTYLSSQVCMGCSSLQSFYIGSGVTDLGNGLIRYCDNVTVIAVSDNNTEYDSRNNCNAIIITSTNALHIGCKTTIIPNTVTSINARAFYGCVGLTSITIPDSVTTIGNGAFRGSGLISITMPDSVTSIGTEVFSACLSLTAVRISNNLTVLSEETFWSCGALLSIDIPDSISSIEESVFENCSGLTSVTISNSVRYIRHYAFKNCTSLTAITYNGTIAQWNAITKGSYWKQNSTNLSVVHCTDGDVSI